MFLPEYVGSLIRRLESAGFSAYAVGGCVRDSLLGRKPHDYDLCTAALPGEIKALFSDYPQFHTGEKHGTISIVTPCGVVEITTYRADGAYRDHRHPEAVSFVPDITTDLARRDFTVNAMAFSPTRGLMDPFGGREDLKNRILRTVGDPCARFQEDALRILRGVRFAARFHLTPHPATGEAMAALAPLMDSLAGERVFSELCQLLPAVSAGDLQQFAPVITQVIPELKPCLGFDQCSPHHAFDLYTHIAYATQAVPPELPLRWAALLHDIGKPSSFTLDETGRGHFYGHAKVGAALADGVLRRLKAPTALRERVVLLIENHMTPLQPERKFLRRHLARFGPETVGQLLALEQADFSSKGVISSQDPRVFPEIRTMLDALVQEAACLTVGDLAVNGRDLLALGFPPGPSLGACLRNLLAQVVDETLPNTREALLEAAARQLPKPEGGSL